MPSKESGQNMLPKNLFSNIPIDFRTIQAGKINTSFLTAGKGKPVVLLHGGGSGAVAWHAVIQYLAQKYYVIAPDIVGYGESDKPHAPYDRPFYSTWLQNFLNALQIEHCVLVGHSLGGAVAVEFAVKNPAQVERLVLVNSAALSLNFPLMPFLKGMWLHCFPTLTASRWLHTSLTAQPARVHPDLIRYAAEVCQKPGGKRAYWIGGWRVVLPFTSYWLRQIKSGTFILWGAEDCIYPPSCAQRARHTIPNVRFQMIQGAGHVPFYDKPEQFNQALMAFLGG